MKPRGAYRKSAASRRQVLEAAIEAIAERGYAQTSVSDVARAAGMSKGAVHYHFESKDDLIAQVAKHCAREMQARVDEAWDTATAPTDKIRRALSEMRNVARGQGPVVRVFASLLSQGVHDEKLKRMLQEMFESTRRGVAEKIVAALPALGLKPKIPAHVIPRLLLSTLDGLALHDFFDPPSEEDNAAIQTALEDISFSLFEAATPQEPVPADSPEPPLTHPHATEPDAPTAPLGATPQGA